MRKARPPKEPYPCDPPWHTVRCYAGMDPCSGEMPCGGQPWSGILARPEEVRV